MFGSTRRAVRERIAQAGLPADIAGFIDAVVRRTRLRRAEQFDLAGELVSHFAEGIATGRTGAELIAAYGDPKASARALRRAAIAKRGAVDRAIGGFFLWGFRGAVAVVLAYLATASVLHFRTPTISIDGNAVMNAWIPEPGSEGPAIELYVRALADEGGVWNDPPMHSRDLAPWELASRIEFDEDARAALRKWTEEERESIRALREVRSRPVLGMPLHIDLMRDERLARFFGIDGHDSGDASVVGTRLPHFRMLRRVTNWLASDAALAAHDGRMDDFVADCEACFAAARHADEARFTISALVSADMRTVTLQTIVSAVENHGDRMSDGDLAALDTMIRADLAAFDSAIGRSIEGERLMARDLLQRCYTDDGSGDGVALVQAIGRYERLGSFTPSARAQERVAAVDFLAAPLVAAVWPSRARLAEEFERRYDELAAAITAPTRAESLALAATLDERLDELRRAQPRFWLVGATVATMTRQALARWSHADEVDSAIAAIGIERFRRANGRFPSELAELERHVGRDLGAASHPDAPWKYALVDGRPLIYDAGIDGIDDRARTPLAPRDVNEVERWSAIRGSGESVERRLVALSDADADRIGPIGAVGRFTERTRSIVGAEAPPDPTQPIADVEASVIRTDGDFIRVWWKSGASGCPRVMPARE